MRPAPLPVRHIIRVPPRPPQAPRTLVVPNPYETDVDFASLEPELVAFLSRLDQA